MRNEILYIAPLSKEFTLSPTLLASLIFHLGVMGVQEMHKADVELHNVLLIAYNSENRE